MEQVAERRALLVVFPELGLSAYSCEDLFQQQALLDDCKVQLASVLRASQTLSITAIVGLPLVVDGLLYNLAAVVSRGRLLGVIPKTYLPNYREFYERRQFVSADCARSQTIDLLDDRDIPFGNQLLFQLEKLPRCTFHVEICEDLWVPLPLSSYAALAGATVLINLSASNVTIGKAEYRRQLVASQSARCLAAYLYTSAGFGESTTDLAWDGHGMIYENGTALAESTRFFYQSQLLTGDLDLDRLGQDRARQTSFADSVRRHKPDLSAFRTISVPAEPPRHERLLLERSYERFPYAPSDPERRDPGTRTGEATTVGRHQQGRDRRLRRTRFDASRDHMRKGNGCPASTAHQYTWPYPAGVCHEQEDPRPGLAAHVRHRLYRSSHRHSIKC
jgi:NAD+ synthase (glutamine-hydrolysing)